MDESNKHDVKFHVREYVDVDGSITRRGEFLSNAEFEQLNTTTAIRCETAEPTPPAAVCTRNSPETKLEIAATAILLASFAATITYIVYNLTAR